MASRSSQLSLSQVLLVTGLGAGALAVVLAIARSAAGDAVVSPVVTATVRAASYLGLMLAAGGTAFVLLAWPRGRNDRRLAAMVWLGWLAIGGTAVLHLAVHEGAGAFVPGGDRIADALAIRLGLLLPSVVWAGAALQGRGGSRILGAVLFVALSCTWIYAGPVAPGAVTVVVTVLHIAAACLWVGGLAVLAAVLLPRGRTLSLARVLTRFSRLATTCVVVLAVTGTYHAWSRAGSASSLFVTPYGYTFWLKLVAVSAMLVVANGNRLYVLRHVKAGEARVAATKSPEPVGANRFTTPAPSDAPGAAERQAAPLQMLGLFLGAEVAFGVLVMILTGVLVDAPVGG